jgi:alpha-mannosidase
VCSEPLSLVISL